MKLMHTSQTAPFLAHNGHAVSFSQITYAEGWVAQDLEGTVQWQVHAFDSCNDVTCLEYEAFIRCVIQPNISILMTLSSQHPSLTPYIGHA